MLVLDKFIQSFYILQQKAKHPKEITLQKISRKFWYKIPLFWQNTYLHTIKIFANVNNYFELFATHFFTNSILPYNILGIS